MLITHLSEIKTLFKTTQNDIQTAVVLYVLRLSSTKDLKRVAREHDISHAIIDLKKHIDTEIYFTIRLWKAIYDWAVHGTAPTKTAKKYSVAEEDVWFIIDHLNSANIKLLQEKAKETPLTNYIIDRTDLIKKLDPIVHRLARRKIRFVAGYDPGYTVEDFAQELLCSGVAIINRYNFQDPNEMLNYVKKSLPRAAVNLIKRHTSTKRSRIKSFEGGFEATTVSMDSNKNDATLNLHRTLADKDHFPLSRDILDRLLQMPNKYQRVVKILLGEEKIHVSGTLTEQFNEACQLVGVDPLKTKEELRSIFN